MDTNDFVSNGKLLLGISIAQKILFLLKVGTSRELGISMAKNVYFALVESHLRYGVCYWGSCAQYLFDSVFLLQKRAIRCMIGLNRRASCKPHFINLNVLTLPCIFILETVCIMHKKFKSTAHVAATTITTRSKQVLKLPIPSTTLIKNSIIYNSRKIFNKLPLYLREIVCGKRFKKEVKEYLIGKAFYTVDEFIDGY